jgi:hypothetical protein
MSVLMDKHSNTLNFKNQIKDLSIDISSTWYDIRSQLRLNI